MSTNMGFFLVEDTDLPLLRGNPALVTEYFDARTQADDVCYPGPNHLNVQTFHLILNGTTDFVGGPCGVFETWFRRLDYLHQYLTDEAVAMNSDDVNALLSALKALDETTIRQRWYDWKVSHHVEEEYDEESFFPDSFRCLREFSERAVSERKALVWVPS